MISIELLGQSIQLLPQRAAFWEEKKTLIVADIHLGKASAMQNAGIPVPEGAMDEDLSNLKHLISQTKAERCIVVGDLIHAKSGLSQRVQEKFKLWVSSIDCPLELILGNHDRSLIKQLPEGWKLPIHKNFLMIEPFCFTHIPQTIEKFFVWSGHLHPQFLLKSRLDHLTLRCFYLTKNQGILPAFSDFVGGSYVKKIPECKIFVIAHTEVISI